MAVYDDEKQKTGTGSPSDDELRRITGTDEDQEGAHEREAYSGAAADILGRESHPGKSSGENTGDDEKKSLFKKESGKDSGGGGGFSFRREKEKVNNLRSRAKKLSKNKWLVGGVGAGSLGLLALIMLLFLIGAQIIPNFAQNMIAYSFARVARETADSTSSVTAEKIALDSAPDATYANAEKTFGNETDPATKENLWKKLDSYRPEKVVDNMRASGQLYFEYGPDKSLNPLKKLTGRQTLQKIHVNGQTIDVPQNSFSTLDKILNPIDYAKGLWQSNRALSSTLADSMNTTLRGTNWIIRSKAAGIIRSKFDIKLYRWSKPQLEEYNKDTNAQANIQEEKESINIETDNLAAMDEAKSGLTPGSQESQAADQVKQDLQNCVGQDACVQQIIDSGGALPVSTVNILNSVFASNIWDTLLKILGPTYAIAAPLCMIYEGSIVNSGGVINANEGEIQRTAYQVTSAADQQKYGNVNGNAIGAQVRQMGDNGEIARSNVMNRASGIPINTSQAGVDPQQAANGTYSYDILSFLGPVGGAIRPYIKTICDIFDNPWSALFIGIITLAVPVVRGGLEAVGQAAGQGIAIIVARLAENLGATLAEMFSKKELAKLAAISAGTIGAAFLAKYIVLQHLAALNNGFSRNKSFDDRAEAGAIDNSQYVERQQNMGVPMSPSGTAQTKVQDLSFMSRQEQQQGVFQRYFAVSNAQSFVSKLGVSAWAHMNLGTIPQLIVSAGRIFNPIAAFNGVFSLFQNKSLAAATSNLDTTDYNIVQYGWTPIEEWHYEHDPNYNMLNNQKALDQSGQEQTISDKYTKCFTSKLGDLLSNGDLRRDDKGIVLTGTGDGDCASDNLSPTNRDDPTQTDNMVFANGTAQLVYRWRVAIRNQNVLNQLLDTQNPTDATTQSTTPTAGGCGSGKYGAIVGTGSSFAGVDQGIDFVPAGGKAFNICAPAAGTITLADQTGHHFMRTSGQALIVEKLDAAPNVPSSSQFVYFAEIITVSGGIKVGTHVNKGDVIGTNSQSPGIELGWGLDATNGFMCGIGYPTACGTSFNNWVQAQ